jgi:hypothetical protein
MRMLPWIIVVLAVLEAGWMTFDGARALVAGDYVTPSSGEYAGQLGPWSKVVTAAGIEPRSTLMKSIFVVYGVVWIVIVVAFIRGATWAWTAMLIAAAGALWYLPVGTFLSLVQIVLLVVLRRSSAG